MSIDTDHKGFPCVCGRKFSTERGMKIHRDKNGMLEHSSEQKSSSVEKTSEGQGQNANHSAVNIHAYISDEEFVKALDAKCERLNLPTANTKDEWEKLDIQLVAKLDTLIGKSTLEHELAIHGDIAYVVKIPLPVACCRDW